MDGNPGDKIVSVEADRGQNVNHKIKTNDTNRKENPNRQARGISNELSGSLGEYRMAHFTWGRCYLN